MLPKMTETQSNIMRKLQSKKNEELDAFEIQMRNQAGQLSMQVHQVDGIVTSMKTKLEQAQQEQNTLAGEFQGIVMAIEAYHMVKQTKVPTGDGETETPKAPEENKDTETPESVTPEEQTDDKKSGKKSKK